MHLDRVCVRFPELKLCMIHGADPWWDTAIRLMIKYKNLRLMTSAWSPKRLPESLLHYMRDPRQGPHHVRLRLPGAVDRALPRRGGRARPDRRGPRRLALRQRRVVLLVPRRPERNDATMDFRTDRRRQPLLRAARRLHPAPRPEVRAARRAAGAGRQARRSCSSGGKVNRFIPNPTFDPIIVPGLPRPAVPRARSPKASTRAR